ncbi:hypothetical protein RI570_11595 [Brucella pseudogrignonensis]|uniref:hypothetical protein n=1 Tax=Brucella TaxID=234 RepID=UPI0028B32C5C|nr:hypothetical protein [Brucella pseudogrignonensis]MDT6940792.1 hypothetical protein [Brucella pseudogrignonensis]
MTRKRLTPDEPGFDGYSLRIVSLTIIAVTMNRAASMVPSIRKYQCIAGPLERIPKSVKPFSEQDARKKQKDRAFLMLQ